MLLLSKTCKKSLTESKLSVTYATKTLLTLAAGKKGVARERYT